MVEVSHVEQGGGAVFRLAEVDDVANGVGGIDAVGNEVAAALTQQHCALSHILDAAQHAQCRIDGILAKLLLAGVAFQVRCKHVFA